MTAKLIRQDANLNFDLVVNGSVYGNHVYNCHHFAATGRDKNGHRFDIAKELNIERVSLDEYIVHDLRKFLEWANIDITDDAAAILHGFNDAK